MDFFSNGHAQSPFIVFATQQADCATYVAAGLTWFASTFSGAGQTITDSLLYKAYICFVPGTIADFRLPGNYYL